MMGVDEAWTRVMLNGYRSMVRPLLFTRDPEAIHDQIIGLLGILPGRVLNLAETMIGAPASPVNVAGIRFPGRVGVAAGLDKDGRAAGAWSHLGFGHVELGTVTAHAQPGNPKPRSFRLKQSHAIINRMGFNNPGAEALAATLVEKGQARGNNALGCPVGISIGKTRVTPIEAAVDDYLFSLEVLAPHADYIAINVSSPNTPGLRSLQDREHLEGLTQALVRRAKDLNAASPVPIFVKVSPDLTLAQLEEIIEVSEDAGISGLIATNTTLSRSLIHPHEHALASQVGGMSGTPLRSKARDMVAQTTSRTELPVIGVGGIMTPADAQRMFDAGAVMLQVFTGFIFKGPALVRGINRLTTPVVG